MTTAVPRGVVLLSLVAGVIVLVQVARMSVFMIDPQASGYSVMPWNRFGTVHSCVSGYWAAGRVVTEQPNVWDDGLSRMPRQPGAPRVVKRLGPFAMDGYEYTPTFLLLPRALLRVTPDFFAFRRVWYVLNLALVVASLIAIARRLQAALGPSVLWLTPVVLAPLSVLVTFQIGNVQLACIAGSALGMLCLEAARGSRHGLALRAGGALLLAYMALSKLYPGMLVMYLLCRRDWLAVAWTSGFGAALVVLGLVDVGIPAHQSFLAHLPALLSGESFPNLQNSMGISANMSIPGIVLKLGLYGVPSMSFGAMRVVGWIYTIVLMAVVVRLASRPVAPPFEPIVWIVILLLATLRSPVLPQYGIFPVVWLVAIVLAARWQATATRRVLLGYLAIVSVMTPAWTLWPPGVHAVFTTTVQTGGAIAVSIGGAAAGARQRARRISTR